MAVISPSSRHREAFRTSVRPCRLPLAEPALVLTALLLSTPSSAHAYIDPGAGPLLWQMLVAGFAGALYQISRWFRRGKSQRKNDESGDE